MRGERREDRPNVQVNSYQLLGPHAMGLLGSLTAMNGRQVK